MNSKFLVLNIIIIIAICGVSAFLLTQDYNINENENKTTNKTVNNITNNKTIPSDNTTHNGITDKNGVTASLNGPKALAKGKAITLIWKITNNGNETINNVEAIDQSNSNNFGAIAPNESKIFFNTLPIHSADVSSPLYIGGYSVTYELNGEAFQFNSNALEIQLL